MNFILHVGIHVSVKEIPVRSKPCINIHSTIKCAGTGRRKTICTAVEGHIPKDPEKMSVFKTFLLPKPSSKPATCEECSEINIVLFWKIAHADQLSTGGPVNICWRIFSSCSSRKALDEQKNCSKRHWV